MPCLSKAGSLDRQPTSTWPWSMSGAGSVEPSLPSASAKPSRESLVRFRNRVGPKRPPIVRANPDPVSGLDRPPQGRVSLYLRRADGREHPQLRLEVVERLFHAIWGRSCASGGLRGRRATRRVSPARITPWTRLPRGWLTAPARPIALALALRFGPVADAFFTRYDASS
jgi:hypothetical protein